MELETQGVGPDVVILPGLPQPPQDLAGVAEELAATCRVTCVHLPGYGRAAAAAVPYDIEAVGAQLVGMLARAGVRRPVLVGMSGGSYRAFQIALDHPGAGVRGMAHLGPLANLDAAHREALRGFAGALSAGVDIADAAQGQFFGPDYLAAQPARCKQIVESMLTAAEPAALAAELQAFAASADLRPRLPALRIPVYLRVGALDQATPVSYAEEIRAALHDAQLDLVPGCGHLIHHEDPVGTHAALRAFVARVHGASA